LSIDGLRADMSLIDDLGVGWIRMDINWQNVERVEGEFDWSEPDVLISTAQAEGFKILGTLVYAPDWAIDESVPANQSRFDVDAYARFAATAAQRYASQIDHWEIWNEPNIATFWGSEPNATAYGQLLSAAYTEIKSTAPQAQVILGGMAPALTAPGQISQVNFLERLYAGGFGDNFDHVGMHPYSFPALPSFTAPWNAYFGMEDLYAVMTANGDRFKEVWPTEFGAPTGSNQRSVSLARQTEIIQEGVECAIVTPWIGPIFLYQHRDEPGGQNDNLENNFGLAFQDRSPKPVFTDIQQLTGELKSNQTCIINF